MFEDGLIESTGRLGVRNPWTTAVSFGAQIVLGGVIVLISLLYTEAIPARSLISTLEAPAPPTQAAPTTRPSTLATHTSEVKDGVLMVPRSIPRSIAIIHEDQAAAESAGSGPPGIPNGVPGAPSNSMLTELLRSTPIATPRVVTQRVRLSSGVTQGLLIRQVKPQYPSLARQARIQGTVVLQAVIGKNGTVQDLRVVSGHPMLTAAAIEAVRQWLFRPYSLNGEPVAVDTQINVNFTLTGD